MQKIHLEKGNLYAGSCTDVFNFRKKIQKFDIIWNLAQEMEHFASLEKTCADVVLLAMIPDFSVPSNIEMFRSQLNEVVEGLLNGKKIFVHCVGGHGRTSIAIALIWIKLFGIDREMALGTTKLLFKGPETELQKQFVLDFQF